MAAPASPLVTARCLLRAGARRPPARPLLARAAALPRAYTVYAAEKVAPKTLSDANSKALLVCSGPLEHYDFLIKEDDLRSDEQQWQVVRSLQKLHESLKGYSISSKNLLSKEIASASPAARAEVSRQKKCVIRERPGRKFSAPFVRKQVSSGGKPQLGRMKKP